MLSIKQLITWGLLALLWASPLWAGPKIQTWSTANGARVLYVEAPELPMVDVRVVLDAAASRESKPGVASLTNSMLTQGAFVEGGGEWNADQIAERMESVGAELGSGSLRDMTWVSVRTLTREPALGTALETLATVLGNPSFPAADLERLRKSTLVALRRSEQKPRSVAKQAFYRAVFGDHPYAGDPLGTKESVEALTREDLLQHYRRHYVAKNAVVALVGAVSREQAGRIAEQVTAGLAAGEPAPTLPPVADPQAQQLQRLDFPSSQSHLLIGQPGMSRKDPDYFALYVGNHILGGNGLVSILSDEVREKRGLSYSVYSYFMPMRERGPFIMGLQTKNSQAEQAREVLLQTLERFMQQGPSAEELTASKQNITGGFPLRISSNGKIVEYLAVIGFYDLPLDYLERFNERVEAVTAEQIRDAFARRMHPEKFVTIVVGSAAEPEVAANAEAKE